MRSVACARFPSGSPAVNPTMTEEFEGAAYRFAHSIVSADINSIHNLGATTSAHSLMSSLSLHQISRHRVGLTDCCVISRAISPTRLILGSPKTYVVY